MGKINAYMVCPFYFNAYLGGGNLGEIGRKKERRFVSNRSVLGQYNICALSGNVRTEEFSPRTEMVSSLYVLCGTK